MLYDGRPAREAKAAVPPRERRPRQTQSRFARETDEFPTLKTLYPQPRQTSRRRLGFNFDRGQRALASGLVRLAACAHPYSLPVCVPHANDALSLSLICCGPLYLFVSSKFCAVGGLPFYKEVLERGRLALQEERRCNGTNQPKCPHFF